MATLDTITARVRRLIEEVDLATTDYDDLTVHNAIADATTSLGLRKIASLDAVVVDPATATMTPATVTTEQGELLALQAADDLLSREFRGRVSRGEIGASWTSGLESESTISASKLYQQALDDLRSDLRTLVAMHFAPTTGARMQ